MRKLVIVAAAVALAAPTAAFAGGATGVSTNGTTNDAQGFCVSAGNANAHEDGTTTGADRSSRAGQPGANAAKAQDARAWCASIESPYPPPGGP